MSRTRDEKENDASRNAPRSLHLEMQIRTLPRADAVYEELLSTPIRILERLYKFANNSTRLLEYSVTGEYMGSKKQTARQTNATENASESPTNPVQTSFWL